MRTTPRNCSPKPIHTFWIILKCRKRNKGAPHLHGKAMHIIIFLLGFQQSVPPDIRYITVQVALVPPMSSASQGRRFPHLGGPLPRGEGWTPLITNNLQADTMSNSCTVGCLLYVAQGSEIDADIQNRC